MRVKETYFIASVARIYSVETMAQWKDLPCTAIAQTNIVHLGGFFSSKFYFLISFDARRNAQDQANSCNL